MKAKIIDIICFVVGSALFIHTLFDFHASSGIGLRETEAFPTYYYTNEQTILLTIGICLIVIGFIIHRWRKESRAI